MQENDTDFSVPEGVPIYVDLDGTLISGDILHESIFQAVRKNVFLIFMFPAWVLFRGLAYMKYKLATRCHMDPSILPYNLEFLHYLKNEREKGRRLVLTTASSRLIAEKIFKYLGIFDNCIASTKDENVKGETKLKLIQSDCGNGIFCYAGNSNDDFPIWKESKYAIIVNPSSPAIEPKVRNNGNMTYVFRMEHGKFLSLLRSFRPHQWVKNLLLFIPVLTAQRFLDLHALYSSGLGAISFCLVASSAYVINDIFDIESDRKHAGKRLRPIACGAVSIPLALASAFALLAAAALITALLPLKFALILLIYLFITTAYSVYLKRMVIVDILTLAGLYTIRIIAGGAVAGISISFWLLAFSVFIFLSLALVKRHSEISPLATHGESGKSPGRGYMGIDKAALGNMGIASGYVAALVMALYIHSPEVVLRYDNVHYLWGVPPILLYFVSRVWILTCRGEMHDDPVLFAIKDRHCLVAGGLCLILFMVASGVFY